jgi:hypothetical protein
MEKLTGWFTGFVSGLATQSWVSALFEPFFCRFAHERAQLLSALLSVAVSAVDRERAAPSALASALPPQPDADAAHLAATIVQRLCVARTDAVAEYDGWVAEALHHAPKLRPAVVHRLANGAAHIARRLERFRAGLLTLVQKFLFSSAGGSQRAVRTA